jgi:uncharacterized membrane protein
MTNSEQSNLEQPGIETKTSTGLQPNLAGALAYVLGWVTGLIFFLIEKENKYVRFHGLQSILFNVAVFILVIAVSAFNIVVLFIPLLGVLIGLCNFVVGVAVFIAWLVLMYKAFTGEKFKLPVIGEIAEKNIYGKQS